MVPPVDAFQITAKEVERLDEDELVRLVNRLIWGDGRRLGVPITSIRITLRIHDPDGGADAITDVGEPGSGYLERGQVVWQFKKSWPDRRKLERDLRGWAVQEAFAGGAGYTLVVGQGMAPATQRRREGTLQELAAAAGCKGNVRLLVADHVAAWASSVPAALFELRPQIRGYMRADWVLREPRHEPGFEPDEARRATMDAIREALFGEAVSTFWVRLQGQPGVGKTGLALELVKSLGQDTLTLYSPNAPSSELFDWVASNDEVETTIIADECDDVEARRLESWAHQCGGRLKLITVGSAVTTGANVYVLRPLDPTTMERVVRAAAPTLDDIQVRWVAEKTRGYVKLAVAVARAIARGTTSVADMPTDRDVQEIVTRLLAPAGDVRRALQGVALLTHVGWEGAVASEGQAVAEFMGLSWSAMQHGLGPTLQEGLVVARGRYRYVSPELLALWLAAEVWRAQAYRIRELYDRLPSQTSRDALLERLTRLGAVPGVQDALEDLLGEGGPFRDVDSLDDGRASHLFSVLAKGAPEAATAALNRIVGAASRERLMQFGPGRRHVVWALEGLLFSRETFFDAARLVRRLAEAENESFSNNATGVWASVFLPFLGQTEVPALDRFVLLEEALDSDFATTRLLAVRGLAAALQDQEIGRVLHESTDVPRPWWRPKVWGEVWAVKRRVLALLERALDDPASEVRREALGAFAQHASALVRQGLAEDVVKWFTRLEGRDEDERHEIWKSMMAVLSYEAARLSEEQRITLEGAAKQIYGDSLTDRIKRYVGPWSHENWPRQGEPQAARPERVAERLAEEAVSAVAGVRPLLPWLFSGSADNVWPFARRLGQIDGERRWLAPLLGAAREGQDFRLLSGYLVGRADAGEGEWRERLLDEWSAEQSLAQIVAEATARGPSSDRGVARLVRLVDRGWLDPATLGWLRYGAWVSGLSPDVLQELVLRLTRVRTPQVIEAALALVQDWIEAHGSDLPEGLEDVAWELLEQPEGWERAAMLGFYWKEVAARLVEEDPVRLARILVRMSRNGEPAFRDIPPELLGRALALAPREVWEVVGSALLGGGQSYRLMWTLRESGLMASLPVEPVQDWVMTHGTKAARALAHTLRPSGERLPEVARFLLREYPSDVGDILASNFTTGSWWGSEATYLEEKIGTARRWLQDDAPPVKRWATEIIAWLRKRANEAKLREEEEELARA